MFRTMRRSGQALPQEEVDSILRTEQTGVLAVLGDEDYPYTVPMNFCYDGESIYFHCAKEGHKLDAVLKHHKASFCVIHKDEVEPETYSTRYQSVIAFGKVEPITDAEHMIRALVALAEKYAPMRTLREHKAEIEQDFSRVMVLKMAIEHVTGKEGGQLAALRKQQQ
ncbi:MAG: pyridoxamine 5'-phosphate oxidase family protein [Clostridiales bacterium]|nr:pyridoxamine 5'-phosphate oxidase family protein [Clostridiales bacterium]